MKRQTARQTAGKKLIHEFIFESFGVEICVASNEAEALEDVKKLVDYALLGQFREISETVEEHYFSLVRNPSKKDSLYKNGEKIAVRINREDLLETLSSRIRLEVAEFAKERVFVHSGVVAWKGKAILIPARSFRGKTTLTVELVKRGALYYSDEYAILDRDGLVHSFTKPVSMRGVIDEFKQVDYEIESFGGKIGTEAIPVGMVVITEYKKKEKWQPVRLSAANGMIELIKNTIPIRSNPTFSLEVLNKVAAEALFVQSPRGDAAESAQMILDFFEKNCF